MGRRAHEKPAGADRRGAWRIPGQLRIPMGMVLLTATAAALLSPILTKYLSDNVSSSIFTLGLAFLPAAVAGSVLLSCLGGLGDRFGRRAPMVIALLVGALAALVVPLGTAAGRAGSHRALGRLDSRAAGSHTAHNV